jgi:hypothetical protein
MELKILLPQMQIQSFRASKQKRTYTMALTPLQYRSHMLRNRGCPPMSQIFKADETTLNKAIRITH